MSKKPKALRMADGLEFFHGIELLPAAAELRRLHEVNEQLLDDLAAIVATTAPSDFAHVRAAHAILKAKEQS